MQKSIPYIRVYRDENTNGGIIETSEGRFSKSYFLDDTNFSDAGEEKQDEILHSFEKILNMFNHSFSYEITINNRTIDQEQFNKGVLMGYQNDGYDDLRAEHNGVLLDKMQEGKNNLKAEKYLTIALNASDIRDALDKFATIEKDLNTKIKHINQTGLKAISLAGRLEILHDIYNMGQEGDFSRYFNLDNIVQQGITTKDAIGPSCFVMDNDHIQIGNQYARALFIKSIPATLPSNLLESLASISTNVLLSVHYEAQEQEKAVAFASGQVTSVGGEVVKAQKSLSKSGVNPDLISPKLATAQKDAKEMLADLADRNQKLFHITIIAVVFAQNMADLNLYTEQIKTKAREHVCQLDVLTTQQEQAFNSALPLGNNIIKTHRVMTSETASAMQPFSTRELQIKGGFYYGLNPLSKNLIIYNRCASKNQNGMILGSPGAGKSFAAKMEIYQAYLNTVNSQIYVIDPEGEYTVLGKRLNATIFSIEPGGNAHINPLDLDITKDRESGDPLAQKIDYVISICERMLGGKTELSGYVKGIIDSTLQELYAPYIAQLTKRGITIDPEICPTLKDLYDALLKRKEQEARNLASSIRMYCEGTLDLFAYPTNVDTNARFIIYDISHIGVNLQELGIQICLNVIWNRMVANQKREIRTWFYVDECHLLLRMPSSAAFLQSVWKRARKYQAAATGISQNVEDFLRSSEGQTILSTSDFVQMLSQAPLDRAALAALFNISEEQQEYFSNVPQGEGLIYTSTTIVPFENHFPNDTEIYKILSTKPEDAEMLSKKQ